jgi:hypothetical protein
MNDRDRLCDGEELLARIFEAGARPSPRWLQMQVKKHGLPSYKIAGLRRFCVPEVKQWLRKNCKDGGKPVRV